MLKLIHGTPRSDLYYKAFLRKLDSLIEYDQPSEGTELMSVVFLGVKAISSSRRSDDLKNIEELKYRCGKLELIKSLMARLTPRQFINIFPIKKEYDGARYQFKDYFSTMEMIRTLEMNEPIGDKIDDLLWNYQNKDIDLFQLAFFTILSGIAKAKGLATPMEIFCVEKGIPLYFEDKKKKELVGPILVEIIDGEYSYDDSEAQTVPLKKSSPDYLSVVKG